MVRRDGGRGQHNGQQDEQRSFHRRILEGFTPRRNSTTIRPMRILTTTIGVLLLLAAAAIQPADSAAQDNFTALFDGKTLKGWNMVGDANWEVVDGAIQATKGAGGFLVTPASYGDFQFTAEIWVSDDANSGVFVRSEDPKNITAMNAYEVNVYDKRPDQTYRTGSIVDVAKPMAQVNAGGRWNTLDITARGTRIQVTMNGTRTVDIEDKSHARGAIALQYGQGSTMVRFRNVRIRSL